MILTCALVIPLYAHLCYQNMSSAFQILCIWDAQVSPPGCFQTFLLSQGPSSTFLCALKVPASSSHACHTLSSLRGEKTSVLGISRRAKMPSTGSRLTKYFQLIMHINKLDKCLLGWTQISTWENCMTVYQTVFAFFFKPKKQTPLKSHKSIGGGIKTR